LLVVPTAAADYMCLYMCMGHVSLSLSIHVCVCVCMCLRV